MDDTEQARTGKRAENAARIRAAIEDALLETLAEGDPAGVNHDRIAERAGIARRTVYRYFPDRQALLEAGWHKLSRAASPMVAMPKSAKGIMAGMEDLFTGFDRNAEAMTVTMASAEGRAIRNAMTPRRVKAYRAALASETAHLDPHRRDMAIATIQLLNSGFAWREYRDQWKLDGADMAKASRWAVAVLIKALEAGEGPAA
ncbi:MAG: helix-turn-helix transcriptional regulator [Sphingobium sp.]|nr:helix-turn-helix transcriptional regulator [Sphingobium sp.]